MKSWGDGAVPDEGGRGQQDEQGDAGLVDRALQGHRLFAKRARAALERALLEAGLPVLNISATSKARL